MKSSQGKDGNKANSERTKKNAAGLRENSNPENEDQDFPGYPHYPAREDIMHPANGLEKIVPDPEKLTRSGAYLDTKKTTPPVSSPLDSTAENGSDDLVIVPGTEADVTKDDLLILGEQDVDSEYETSVDEKVLSGDLDTQLDVPGEELDDDNEDVGEEDEENNYYSLGSDSKNNLDGNQ